MAWKRKHERTHLSDMECGLREVDPPRCRFDGDGSSHTTAQFTPHFSHAFNAKVDPRDTNISSGQILPSLTENLLAIEGFLHSLDLAVVRCSILL